MGLVATATDVLVLSRDALTTVPRAQHGVDFPSGCVDEAAGPCDKHVARLPARDFVSSADGQTLYGLDSDQQAGTTQDLVWLRRSSTGAITDGGCAGAGVGCISYPAPYARLGLTPTPDGLNVLLFGQVRLSAEFVMGAPGVWTFARAAPRCARIVRQWPGRRSRPRWTPRARRRWGIRRQAS